MSKKVINLGDVNNFPDINSLIRKSKAMAILDAILEPEWNFRYYSFDSKWDNEEMMASMRDGSGNHYFVLFKKIGAIIKEFNKDASIFKRFESPEIIKALSNNLPKEFEDFIKEPAFQMDETTFLTWNLINDPGWKVGEISIFDDKDINTSAVQVSALTGNYQDYVFWAKEYYEKEIDEEIVKQVFEYTPLNSDMIKRLNPDMTLEDLEDDIEEIDYPLK